MESALILVMVIVSPLVVSAAVLFRASEEWLQGYVEMAHSLGRPM